MKFRIKGTIQERPAVLTCRLVWISKRRSFIHFSLEIQDRDAQELARVDEEDRDPLLLCYTVRVGYKGPPALELTPQQFEAYARLFSRHLVGAGPPTAEA